MIVRTAEEQRRDVTVEQFGELMHDIIKRHPDNINPYSITNATCQYNWEGKHCLIGQFLVEHDPTLLPTDQEINAYDLLIEAGYSHVVSELAGVYQTKADAQARPITGDGLTWGQTPVPLIQRQWTHETFSSPRTYSSLEEAQNPDAKVEAVMVVEVMKSVVGEPEVTEES